MNPAAYNDVVVDATMEEIKGEHQKSYTPQEAALVRDITKGRVIWENHYLTDYWIYLKNNHILLGIFLAHPLHPYSKRERALIVFCGIFMAFFVAAAANSQYDWLEGTGLDQDEKSIVYGIFVFMYNLIMREVATCSCVQQKRKNVKNFFEAAGYLFMVIGGAFSLALLSLGVLALLNSDDTSASQVVESFFISQASSWMYGFGFAFLFFTFYRYLELRKKPDSEDGVEFIDKEDAEPNRKTTAERLALRAQNTNGSEQPPSASSTMTRPVAGAGAAPARPGPERFGSKLVEAYHGDVSSDDEDDGSVHPQQAPVNPVPTNSRSQQYQPQPQFQAQPVSGYQQPQLQQPMYGQAQQQYAVQPQVQMAYGQQQQQYGMQPQQQMYNQYGQQQPQGYNQFQGR